MRSPIFVVVIFAVMYFPDRIETEGIVIFRISHISTYSLAIALFLSLSIRQPKWPIFYLALAAHYNDYA